MRKVIANSTPLGTVPEVLLRCRALLYSVFLRTNLYSQSRPAVGKKDSMGAFYMAGIAVASFLAALCFTWRNEEVRLWQYQVLFLMIK